MKKLLFLLAIILPAGLCAQSKSYTIVFLNHKPDAEKVDKDVEKKLFEGHMANINRLASEGKLLAAGPFQGGGGIFILNTTSVAEATGWVDTDPAVQAKRWDLEILPYTPRIGSICPVSEPYEMVSYTFVRFDAVVDKSTAQTYPAIILHHENFVKELSKGYTVVTEAIFGPHDGGILVLKEDLPPDSFSADPGVQQGLIDARIRKLYIARTSFCEL